MEQFSAFLWDIFKNVLGNRVDALVFGKMDSTSIKSDSTTVGLEPTGQEPEQPQPSRRRFKSFDAVYDLAPLLEYVDEPIVYLLIEDSPSTAYNLPAYVLESQRTGEWFVFSRGRMAFQGTGGGLRNTRGVFDTLKEKRAKIGAWVVPKELLDRFEFGQVVWPTVKMEAVPLLAHLAEDFSWSEIQSQFRSLNSDAP